MSPFERSSAPWISRSTGSLASPKRKHLPSSTGLLKRAAEKFTTERACDNPKFLEDVVRDIALRLKRDPRVGRFTAASENFESILNHSAYVEISDVDAPKFD